MFKIKLLAVLTGVILFSLCLVPTANGQQSSLTQAQMEELALEFAPRLYLHPDEAFKPVSPEYAISRSDLKNIDTGLVTSNPTASQLSALADLGTGYYLDNRMGTIYDDGIKEDFLDISDNYAVTVYYRVTERTYGSREVYAIQYFFYYAFNNGPMNTHEGDWETVMVVCDTSHEPVFAAYSQHLGGERAEWDLVSRYGTHPNVYVAVGSHANYYRPYQGKLGPAADSCSDDGRLLSPSVYSAVNLDDSAPGMGWLNFAGCWGDYGSADSGIMGERGPVGPRYQGDRWDDPMGWADSLTEVTDETLMLNQAVSNMFLMILGIMALVLIFTVLAIYFRRKKQGTLGPRLTPFLYVTGANAASAASVLAIIAIVIGLVGYFMPWYTVTADISAGDYSTPGPVEILRTDGLHGLSFNRPEPGAGMVQVVGLPIPFAWLMLFGLFIFVLGTVGMMKTRKFGWKLMGRAFGVLMPAIVLMFQVSLIGSFVSGFVQDAPPEVTGIIETVSANPLHGSATQSIGSYGAVTLEWGIGPGVIMFIIAAVMLFFAGTLLIANDGAYFATGRKPEPAQAYQQTQYPSPQPGYYPPPGCYPPPFQPAITPRAFIMYCPACGQTSSAVAGAQPYRCSACGTWMYPPVQ